MQPHTPARSTLADRPGWSRLRGSRDSTGRTTDRLHADRRSRGGAIIRPFRTTTKPVRARLPRRAIGVLVALADLVLVAQGGIPSGTLSAASERPGLDAATLGGCGPTVARNAEGIVDAQLIKAGARVLGRKPSFARRRLLANPPRSTETSRGCSKPSVSDAKHPDELALETGLSSPAVTTALLTLALGT